MSVRIWKYLSLICVVLLCFGCQRDSEMVYPGVGPAIKPVVQAVNTKASAASYAPGKLISERVVSSAGGFDLIEMVYENNSMPAGTVQTRGTAITTQNIASFNLECYAEGSWYDNTIASGNQGAPDTPYEAGLYFKANVTKSSSTWGFNWQGGGRLDEETRWPTVMKKYIPECFEVIENGVCGRTIGDYMPVKSPTNGIQSLRRVRNLCECDAVIIMLGNNDTLASPESSVSAIASGLGTMVEIIREQNKNAHIFLASPVPISTNCDDKDMFMTFFESQVNKSKALPQEIKKVAEECGCTFIEAGKYVSCDGTDGIHFSAESNKILAVYMADFLNMENW